MIKKMAAASHGFLAVTVFQPAGGVTRLLPVLVSALFLISGSAQAGCLSSSSKTCSPTIDSDGEVGITSYSSLPFAGSVFAQSWGASAGLLPANLFWREGKISRIPRR